jgi:hypothetical protein
LKIGVAACEGIWSRLSEKILHTIGDQKSRRKRQTASQPSREPFPQLPSIYQNLWR